MHDSNRLRSFQKRSRRAHKKWPSVHTRSKLKQKKEKKSRVFLRQRACVWSKKHFLLYKYNLKWQKNVQNEARLRWLKHIQVGRQSECWQEKKQKKTVKVEKGGDEERLHAERRIKGGDRVDLWRGESSWWTTGAARRGRTPSEGEALPKPGLQRGRRERKNIRIKSWKAHYKNNN